MRELGFGKVDSLTKTIAYTVAGVGVPSTLPEIYLGEKLDELEKIARGEWVSNVHRPRDSSTLVKTSRSHLDTAVISLQLSYRFEKDLFSPLMEQRYQSAIPYLPRSAKQIIDAINTIPKNATLEERAEYLEKIDESLVIKHN